MPGSSTCMWPSDCAGVSEGAAGPSGSPAPGTAPAARGTWPFKVGTAPGCSDQCGEHEPQRAGWRLPLAYRCKDRERRGTRGGSLWPQELGAQEWEQWGAGQEGDTQGEDVGPLSTGFLLQILICR